MTPFLALTDSFSVAAQLEAADFARAAQAGFALVINNRPDGEAPGQLRAAQAREAAQAAGLDYSEIQFAGPPSAAEVEALAAILAADSRPILAYCRTGTRSSALWALASAKLKRLSADEILARTSAAGYQHGGLRPLLENLAQS